MSVRVLIVEDDSLLRDSMDRALRARGYETVTAAAAGEALELLELEEVDIVLSDQRMPDLPGTELLSRVRRFHPSLVRLLLTGDDSLKVARDAINRGRVHRYLQKPVSVEDLAREIETVLEETRDLTSQRLRRRVLAAYPELMIPSDGPVEVTPAEAAAVFDALHRTLGTDAAATRPTGSPERSEPQGS